MDEILINIETLFNDISLYFKNPKPGVSIENYLIENRKIQSLFSQLGELTGEYKKNRFKNIKNFKLWNLFKQKIKRILKKK